MATFCANSVRGGTAGGDGKKSGFIYKNSVFGLCGILPCSLFSASLRAPIYDSIVKLLLVKFLLQKNVLITVRKLDKNYLLYKKICEFRKLYGLEKLSVKDIDKAFWLHGKIEKMHSNKNIYIIAGPNGAGKTTFANAFIPATPSIQQFVNADPIDLA